jgi:hypothetical protein
MNTDRCGNTCRKKYRAKGSGKEVKIQEFRYRDTTKVEPEMYDYTSYNLSHRNSNENLRKNLEAIPGKHSIDSLQKTAVLGTSHTLRKVPERKPLTGTTTMIIIIIIIIIIINGITFHRHYWPLSEGGAISVFDCS